MPLLNPARAAAGRRMNAIFRSAKSSTHSACRAASARPTMLLPRLGTSREARRKDAIAFVSGARIFQVSVDTNRPGQPSGK